LELTTADDGAYIICGFLNPNCRIDTTTNQQTGHPHDPSYDMKSMNERCKEIRTVVLYFPSTGNYYSPRFVLDTSWLRAKGLWLRNHHLATKNILQMLPSTALRIQKSDGMPDSTGQLLNFTNVYRIDVCCSNTPISTLQPSLKGVHVDDKHILIPPDFIIGRSNEFSLANDTTEENNELLRKVFVQELSKSISNKAGCKRYVPGSFIAYPEKFMPNPVVVDSYLINNNQQLLMKVEDNSVSPVIGLQSSIRIQHMEGEEYCSIRQCGL